MLEDLLHRATALAMEAAASPKAWARAAGVGERQGRRVVQEGRGAVYDLTRQLWTLNAQRRSRGYVVIAHLQATLMQAGLTMSDAELVARFFELTEGEELVGDDDENRAVVRGSGRWDPEALERADLVESAIHAERAAVVRELKRRGINPHRWRLEHER